MIWLTEDPAPILILGTLTALLLVAIWWHGRQRIVLYLALVAVLLTVAGYFVEQWIVTPREKVAETLHEIAREVENNDLAAVVRHIHSSKPALRDDAEQKLATYEFDEIKIKNNLEVVVFAQEQPPRATAKFNVVAIGSQRSGMIRNRRVPQYLEVTFLLEDGEWRVSDYTHHDPQRGFMKQDAPYEQY